MKIERLNGKAWDEESRKKNFWTNGLTEGMKEKLESGKQSIWVTPKSDVPFSWLDEKGNGKALNLGGGGGQQTVILSRLGFSVTTIDVSERQIRKDKKALEEYGLAAELINGEKWEEIATLAAEAREKFQGLEFAHVGINTPNESAALEVASALKNFSMKDKNGNSSIFMNTEIEVVKKIYKKL